MIKLNRTVMKLLKNLNEFSQSFARYIFAAHGRQEKNKEGCIGGNLNVCMPHDLLPYVSHVP